MQKYIHTRAEILAYFKGKRGFLLFSHLQREQVIFLVVYLQKHTF